MKTFNYLNGRLSVSEPVDSVDKDGLPIVSVRGWDFDAETAKKVLSDFPDMPDEIRQQIGAA